MIPSKTRMIQIGAAVLLPLGFLLYKGSAGRADSAQASPEDKSSGRSGSGAAGGEGGSRRTSSAEGERRRATVGFGNRASSAGGKHLDLGRIGGFVKERWNDPAALAAVYALNPDGKISERLKELAEKDPVAAASLALMSGQRQVQAEYAERLMALAPDDAMGYLISAEMKFRQGDAEAGEALLSQASSLQKLDGFREGILSAQDEVWKAEGSDEIERGLILAGDPWTKKLHGIVGGLAIRAIETDDADQLAQNASTALGLVNLLKSSPGLSLNMERSLISLESTVLQNLPSDFEIDGEMTSRQYLERLTSREAEINKHGKEVYGLLNRSSPDICQEYFKRSRESGELDAANWLVGKTPPR